MSHKIEYDNKTKERLITFIYDSVDIGNYKYKVMQDETDMIELQKDFYVCRNCLGTNSLLVFIKFGDKYYSFIVDRRTLSFNRLQVDIRKVDIYPIKVRVGKDLYKGTIFDGTWLKGKNSKFVINDCYIFQGKSMLNTDLLHKSLQLSAYMYENYVDDNKMNTVQLVVNKLYEIKNTRNLIDDIGNIRGLSFYPPKSGLKYVLMNNSSNKNLFQPEKEVQYEPIKEDTEGVFDMRKTSKMDVYKLYLLKLVEKGNKQYMKYIRIPSKIAYIPTKECSEMCRELFEEDERRLMYCKYDSKKQKWKPVNICTDKKKPSKFYDIYKQIVE